MFKNFLKLLNKWLSNNDPPEIVEPTLRKSTRKRRSAIPSNYVVYLQESGYNIGAENDPETFS